MKKKKPNVILFTLLMIIIFLFITEGIIWGYGGNLIYYTISNHPQGNLVVSEAILAVMVFIVLLIFKNGYIFTEKKEKIGVGLFYGLFYLLGSILFMLLYGVYAGGFKSGLTIINVVIGCFLVGLCEEFLCRGWLLNEFLERYGDNKKGIWYSIIISGIIFGLMHLGNIFVVGQNPILTITQIINAAALGTIFGVIYYKTKNIWSVVLLHGLWDFSLYLGVVAPISDKTEVLSSFSVIGLIFTILMMGAELVNIIPYVKDIDAKPKKSDIITCAILSIIFYLIFLIVSASFTAKIGNTYEYKELYLDNYAVTTDNYDEYMINYQN